MGDFDLDFAWVLFEAEAEEPLFSGFLVVGPVPETTAKFISSLLFTKRLVGKRCNNVIYLAKYSRT